MKRVFYRLDHELTYWTAGKEYEVNVDEGVQFLMDDDGDKRYVDLLDYYGLLCSFTRIERDEPEPQTEWQALQAPTFEAHGFTWNKHVPGDPMPCHGASKIDVISDQGSRWIGASASGIFESGLFCGVNIIGWRYADTKPESTEPELLIEVDDVITHREMLAMDAEPLKSTDNMGVSKPVVDEWIKRENEFTEKQQAKQEAEAQKEQAKAEQMAQAGEVFSREYGSLNDHRLGYRQ